MQRRSLLAILAAMVAAGAIMPAQQASANNAQPRRPDVIYVPTSNPVVTRMLEVAHIRPSDVVYDLGCGDGRIPIMAAQRFGARGVGIDINPERIREARQNARDARVEDRVSFIEGDLFHANISEATVVTLYLGAAPNLKLRPRLLKDLRPGEGLHVAAGAKRRFFNAGDTVVEFPVISSPTTPGDRVYAS
jgi:SAM-dependent methyltransferase